MKRNYISVKLKDPQPYYFEDESIACIVDIKTEKVLKDPMITLIFKGRSSCYNNFSRTYHLPIFDIEQEIKHPRIDMEAAAKKIVSAEFKVEVPKAVSIPSSRVLEVGDGGKIEYMIEAVLDAAGMFKRNVLAQSIIVVPMISKINVDKEELSRLVNKEIRWPRNEADVNTCILNASIPRSGWVRGSSVPVIISWSQPERMNSVKSVLLTIVRQELISSSRDTPPDMTKQLKDKVVEKTEKELTLMNGPNRTLGTNLQHSIEIPSNIVPTISENGKVMCLDYKICVTVQVPGMEPNGGDKELSVNLPIIIGTEGKIMVNDDTPILYNYGGMNGESLPNNPGGFRMPEPMIPQVISYQSQPNQFRINLERNAYITTNEEDIPNGMPVPFIGRPDSVSDGSKNNSVNGNFSPVSIPDCYPPLDDQSYMPDSGNIPLGSPNFSPMPTNRRPTTHRENNYSDPYLDEKHLSGSQRRSPPITVNTTYYKPEEGSPI